MNKSTVINCKCKSGIGVKVHISTVRVASAVGQPAMYADVCTAGTFVLEPMDG